MPAGLDFWFFQQAYNSNEAVQAITKRLGLLNVQTWPQIFFSEGDNAPGREMISDWNMVQIGRRRMRWIQLVSNGPRITPTDQSQPVKATLSCKQYWTVIVQVWTKCEEMGRYSNKICDLTLFHDFKIYLYIVIYCVYWGKSNKRETYQIFPMSRKAKFLVESVCWRSWLLGELFNLHCLVVRKIFIHHAKMQSSNPHFTTIKINDVQVDENGNIYLRAKNILGPQTESRPRPPLFL